jgi:hypothetical protein
MCCLVVPSCVKSSDDLSVRHQVPCKGSSRGKSEAQEPPDMRHQSPYRRRRLREPTGAISPSRTLFPLVDVAGCTLRLPVQIGLARKAPASVVEIFEASTPLLFSPSTISEHTQAPSTPRSSLTSRARSYPLPTPLVNLFHLSGGSTTPSLLNTNCSRLPLLRFNQDSQVSSTPRTLELRVINPKLQPKCPHLSTVLPPRWPPPPSTTTPPSPLAPNSLRQPRTMLS